MPQIRPTVSSCYVGAESGAGVHACLSAWHAGHSSFVFDADCRIVGSVVGVAETAVAFAHVLMDGAVRSDAVVCACLCGGVVEYTVGSAEVADHDV